MTWPSGPASGLGPIRERADLERARAIRAGMIALRHERLVRSASEPMKAFHLRMADTHRKIEFRHLTAARLHDTHVDRLRFWFAGMEGKAGFPPRLISAVAAMLGARSAGITLLGLDQVEASVVSSDSTAAAAQDLEFTLGEGPVHDATSGGMLVLAEADTLPYRWPQYSPALTRLGVRSVAVAPLGPPSTCLGAVAVFDPRRTDRSHDLAVALESLADALTHTVLLTEECRALLSDEDPAPLQGSAGLLLGDADYRSAIHQAAGMVAAQRGCTVDDALALIRARAFAESARVDVIARQIVERRLRLDEADKE